MKKLLIPIIMLILIESASATLYNFSQPQKDNMGHTACEICTLGAGGTPTNPYDDCESTATEADYKNINVSDNVYWKTTCADEQNEYQTQVYHFNITEDPDLISRLKVYWEGKSEGDRSLSSDLSTFIWNAQDSTWEEVDSQAGGSDTDVWNNNTFLTDLSDYIDEGNGWKNISIYSRQKWYDPGGGCPFIYACYDEECEYFHDPFSMSWMHSLEDTSYQTYQGKTDYIKFVQEFTDEISHVNEFEVYGITPNIKFLPEEDNGILHSIDNPQLPYETEGNSYYFDNQGNDAKIIVNARHTRLPIWTGQHFIGGLGGNWYDFWDWMFNLPLINKIWRDTTEKNLDMHILVNGEEVESIRAKSDTINDIGEDNLVYVENIPEGNLNITLKYVDGWYTVYNVTVDFSDDIPCETHLLETDFTPFSLDTGDERIINIEENDYDNYLIRVKGWYYAEWGFVKNKTFPESVYFLVTKLLPVTTLFNWWNYVEHNREEIESLRHSTTYLDTDFIGIDVSQPTHLEVNTTSPCDDPCTHSVTVGNTFQLNATVICKGGYCQEIEGMPRYNVSGMNPDTAIPTEGSISTGSNKSFVNNTLTIENENPLNKTTFTDWLNKSVIGYPSVTGVANSTTVENSTFSIDLDSSTTRLNLSFALASFKDNDVHNWDWATVNVSVYDHTNSQWVKFYSNKTTFVFPGTWKWGCTVFKTGFTVEDKYKNGDTVNFTLHIVGHDADESTSGSYSGRYAVCDGENISMAQRVSAHVWARFYEHPVPITPMYIISNNINSDLSCGNMDEDETCQLNWTVNTTNTGGWAVNVNFTTPIAALYNETEDVNVSVTSGVVPGDTCDCSSIQAETPIDCSENCDIDDCDVGGIDVTFTNCGTITVMGDVTNIQNTIFDTTTPGCCAVVLKRGKRWG